MDAAVAPTSPRFDQILNFRDVGHFVNRSMGQLLLKPGHLYRSARPDQATPNDRKHLVEEFRIKTIIDLRTPTEHTDSRQKHAQQRIPPPSGATPPEPLRIPGIDYRDVNFNGSAYSSALIKQLTWSQTARLFSLYAIGYRKEAISVLGENVMARRGLAGLAEDSLLHCTAEVKAVFDVLSTPEAYPVMVHCTQGKDRTGLVVLLALMLLHVPLEAVDGDYRWSERELEPERREKLREIRSIGLPDEFADCAPDWARTVAAWVDERYGGVPQYLKSCGVTPEQQERTRSILHAGHVE